MLPKARLTTLEYVGLYYCETKLIRFYNISEVKLNSDLRSKVCTSGIVVPAVEAYGNSGKMLIWIPAFLFSRWKFCE